jgi:hypothetical protein
MTTGSESIIAAINDKKAALRFTVFHPFLLLLIFDFHWGRSGSKGTDDSFASLNDNI